VIDLKMSEGSFDTERLALKAKNRYQILKSDCVNIDLSLQQLSNNQETSGLAVVNGLNREKIVSQIPYLKGYFFLYQLSQLLGMDSFLIALRRFVQQFHLCLVSTLEIVEFFCSNSSHNTAIRQLANSWLYSADLPVLAPPTHGNRLIIEIEEHLKYWSRPRGAIPVFTNDCPDQIVALLDKLLELPLPTKKDFHRLVEHYEPQRVNADAYHRLCELVVAGEYFDLVHLVRTFLLNHPAMGAYLYGELMLTQLPFFQPVAIQVYQTLKSHLDPECNDLSTIL
jgi:aminopeptidase O